MNVNDVVKESLIRVILSFSPRILQEDVLKTLSCEKLREIVDANRNLNYYASLIRNQKISVIRYVYEEKYSLVDLYSLDEEELDVIYLKAIRKNREEFNKDLEFALAEFREESLANGHEEYLSFSEEEAIIASGALMPPNLLTEGEYASKSILFRIHEITKKIDELNKENSESEAEIATTRNYNEITELRSDIRYNNQCIIELQAELKQLINPDSDNLALTRKKDEE